MRQYSIAAISADSVGHEVVGAALEALLRTLPPRDDDFSVKVERFPGI
jgi:isocitrate/isopropylmalate dehydrogenase